MVISLCGSKFTVIYTYNALMKMIDSDLFNIDIPTERPSPGSLLVAEPFLTESYFQHSVICLIDYATDKESMGFVMNKPTTYQLSELVEKVSRKEPVTIYCGGPMSQDRMYFIHTLGDIIPKSEPIGDTGLFFDGDFNSIIDYVNSGYTVEGTVRFYLGYSGWSIGQLDEELRENVWAVTSAKSPDVLTGSGDSYWHDAVRMLGPNHRWWLYHPQHPRLN